MLVSLDKFDNALAASADNNNPLDFLEAADDNDNNKDKEDDNNNNNNNK
jgi:hypothetical protein